MAPKSETLMSHTTSVPLSAEPTRLPRAPTTAATSMPTTATTRALTVLAASTRPRWGTRVKVVSPVRWLHSEVTERIAMTGRMIAIGIPTAPAKDP